MRVCTHTPTHIHTHLTARHTQANEDQLRHIVHSSTHTDRTLWLHSDPEFDSDCDEERKHKCVFVWVCN